MTKPHANTAYTATQAVSYDVVRFSDPAGKAIHTTEMAMVKDALGRLAVPSRVLEVGCGTGRILHEVAALGHQVQGADASPQMLRELRKKLPEATVAVAGAADLPFGSSSFDFVYAIRLLNQTESPEYALSVVSEMLRVAKPEGYALVEFVNKRRPKAMLSKTVALTPREVVRHGLMVGATLVWLRGAFLGGMTAVKHTPDRFVDRVSILDQTAARLLPNLCARGYALFRKHSTT